MNSATHFPTRLSLIKSAIEAGAYKAVIKLTSGQVGMDGIWNTAMNAFYGRGQIHRSRCDEQGRPTEATLAEFPWIAFEMNEAREQLPYLVSRFERFGYV
jgi:hypothetical protein